MYEDKFTLRDNVTKSGYYAVSKKADAQIIVGDPTNGQRILAPMNTVVGKLTGLSTRIQGTLFDQVQFTNTFLTTGPGYGAIKSIDFNLQATKPVTEVLKNVSPFIALLGIGLGVYFFSKKKKRK